MDKVIATGSMKKGRLILSFALLFSSPILAVAAHGDSSVTTTVSFTVVEDVSQCDDFAALFSLGTIGPSSTPGTPNSQWKSGALPLEVSAGYSCSDDSSISFQSFSIDAGIWASNNYLDTSAMSTGIYCNESLMAGGEPGQTTNTSCSGSTSNVAIDTFVPAEAPIGTELSNTVGVTAVL